MGDLEYITKELDVHAFKAGIFMSDANLFSPVAVYPIMRCQVLETFLEEQKKHPSLWMTYAGPAGIGQYSLKRKTPAGILARFDVHFRHPTKEEMQDDFQNFGEQVLGPPVAEVPENERAEYKCNATFNVRKEDHYFTGPARIIKSMFLTRVFTGEVPKDITPLIQEVDKAAETGEMITSQGYQFLHATDGKMIYLPFNKPEEFNPTKLVPFGHVEIKGRRMTYYPKGDRNHPIDFTQEMRD